MAANKLGGINWLNSEKWVKQRPSSGWWYSDNHWKQQGWRAGRDRHQWERRCPLSKGFS